MLKLGEGALRKMVAQHHDVVQYNLVLGDSTYPLNKYLGQKVAISYKGAINCCHCGRATKKSFNQGYCYPCFQRLAQCDRCIMSPELCHFLAGTCREPEWGEANCNVDHIVYLANSSHLKVGITRGTQVPTRWMDQGAIQALPIARVQTRRLSGLVEVLFKAHVSDRTDWRAMLKQSGTAVDMQQQWQTLQDTAQDEMAALQAEHGLQAIQWLDGSDAYDFNYPVLEYPTKVSSLNLEKTPEVSGVLKGIKGQYLILDTGVINLRKYTSYNVEFFVEEN